MIWALANNRLFYYAGTEVVLIAAIVAAIGIFSACGVAPGPAIAYPMIYGLGAVVAGYLLLRRAPSNAALSP
jgi:hypothetical protein